MAKFSKKYYTNVASILKESLDDVTKSSTPAIGKKIVTKMFHSFSILFKENNENFDEETFEKAVYGG